MGRKAIPLASAVFCHTLRRDAPSVVYNNWNNNASHLRVPPPGDFGVGGILNGKEENN